MDYNQMNKYIEFSQEVFNYLNGKINIINKDVILSIYPYNVGLLGEIKQRATLRLYIYDIINRCDNNEQVIKNNILFTIVHELYHADQELSPFEYSENQQYQEMIENSVNYMAIIYIKTNKQMLENLFNMNIMINHLEYFLRTLMDDDSFIRYKRIDLFNYYNELLNYLFSNIKYDFSNELYYQPNIRFICNGEEFIIKRNWMFNENIGILNRIIHENYVKSSCLEHSITLQKGPDFITFSANTRDQIINAIEFIE